MSNMQQKHTQKYDDLFALNVNEILSTDIKCLFRFIIFSKKKARARNYDAKKNQIQVYKNRISPWPYK